MGRKIAIKGHFTRGWEVIEILEMLGGVNGKINKKTGEAYNIYNGMYFIDEICYIREVAYYIDFESQIRCIDIKDITTHFIVYSLEMFLKTFPYKLNEMVLCDDGLLGIITKMEWDCEKSDMKYYISLKTPVYNKWYSSKNIKCKIMEAKGKKLAILGHKTRGNEVIELLKMMGGINESNHSGKGENSIYYLNYYVDNVVADIHYQIYPNTNDDDFKIFTLEKFLERFPYKVGDEFCNPYDKITEMFWDEEDEIVYYKTEYSRDYVTTTDIMLDNYARIG